MNYDIGDLLNGWEFNPDEFLARRIRTGKGEEKLQIRIDMGVLQLELGGRPDGQTPRLPFPARLLPRSHQKARRARGPSP